VAEEENRIARVKWEELRDRIKLGIFLVLASIATLYLLYVFFYHRQFKPQLAWASAEGTTFDFDQSGVSRLLLGTLTVRNTGRLLWFGRLLRNNTQPRPHAELRLEYDDDWLNTGSDKAIGFLTPEQQGQQLTTEIKQDMAHNDRFDVFFATEAVPDYTSVETEHNPVDKIIPLHTFLNWQSRRGNLHELTEHFESRIQLLRERAKPPVISFRAIEKPYYIHGEQVPIGALILKSTAQHTFAQPFEVVHHHGPGSERSARGRGYRT